MPEITSSRYLVTADWDDVPHLDAAAKAELLSSFAPHQRDARTKGIPALGSGAIYPVPWEDITVAPFQIPDYWPKAFALDVGWNKTACLWGAWDQGSSILYVYSEHYKGQDVPLIHAEAIKARGAWIPGVIDPAAQGRSQRDGEQLIADYRKYGLNVKPADNAVEAGIYEVWGLLTTGRLKIFSILGNFKDEYRMYRRDEKGKIVKKNDHLMDCLHGDTIVETDQGSRKIRDLVGTTGKVLTVGGDYADYEHCKLYGENRDVVKLTFSNGKTVICTPDHKFLSFGGWVEAEKLAGLHVIHTDYPCYGGTIGYQCISVERAGKADVYCLTVPSTSCFAIEGGIITHNCLRYLCVSGKAVATVKPVQREARRSATAGDAIAGY